MELNAKTRSGWIHLIPLACALISATLLAGCANKPPSCSKPAEFCLDPKLVGVWIDARPNQLSAYYPEVRGIEIDPDGKTYTVGFNYRTGKIARTSHRPNPVKLEYACQEKYVVGDMEYVENYRSCKTYQVNEDELRVTDPRSPDSSSYVRGKIGQAVAQPMDIRVDMLINGNPYLFDDVSSEWPAKSFLYQIAGKQTFSIKFGDSKVRLSIIFKEFRGLGLYELSKEKNYSILLDDARGGGDGYLGFDKITHATPASFVEITSIDLQNKRTVGRIEATLEGHQGITRKVSATFDVPLIIPPPRPATSQ